MVLRDEVTAATFAALDSFLRRASIAQIGGFRPPADPITSSFGGRFVATANEGWPSDEGRPMIPLLQVRTDELPYIPPELEGIALINVFIGPLRLPHNLPAENGHGWLLRSYPSLDGLSLLTSPADIRIRPFPVRWHLSETEGPDWVDAWDLYDLTAFNKLEDAVNLFHDRYAQYGKTKVGGWPGYVQESPGSDGYVFQIGSEEKPGWMWGDSGGGYVVLRDDKWFLHWDCF